MNGAEYASLTMPTIESETAVVEPRSSDLRAAHKVNRGACALVCVVTALLVFVLPLFVPMPPLPIISSAYMAGFNNAVAVRFAVSISVAVLIWALWNASAARVKQAVLETWEAERIGWRFTAMVMGVSSLVIAVCGWLVALSGDRYLNDAGYIVEQATVLHETGRHLYTQVEFAYGPLLLLPVVWLKEALHVSMMAAYFTALVVESAIGLLLVRYLLNELPVTGRLRHWFFALAAVGAITPHLGLNYTFFRFLSPLALLWFGTRQRSPWRCLLVLSAGEALELLISPELGLALGAGVLVYGAVRGWQAGWRWIVAALAPLAVLASLLLTLGRPYLAMSKTFARGTLNLPVGPYPHILVLLFALVWLVPVGLSRAISLRTANGAALLAAYVSAIAMMPAALGRCDPLHVFFDGAGVLLLSLILVSRSSRRTQLAWVASIALLVYWEQRSNKRLFEARTVDVLEETIPRIPLDTRMRLVRVFQHVRPWVATMLQRPRTAYLLDMPALEQLTGGAPIATPADLSPAVEEQLKQSHQYSPGYYAFLSDMMSPAAEQKTIREASAEHWMLLPKNWKPFQEKPDNIALFQAMRMPYRQRRPSLYVGGEAFLQDVAQNWTPVQVMGPYVLYEQRH